MKKLFVIKLLMVSLLFFSFNDALAIGTPTAVCPAVPYGQIGPYYSSRTPTFMWTSVGGATWYQIYLSYADSTETALLKQWVRGINSWTFNADFELYPGEEYSWWVRAYDGSYGSWSNRADFTVGHRKILSLSPTAFAPYIPTYPCTYASYGSAIYPLQNSETYNHFYTPLMLPDNSRIEYLKMYYENSGDVSLPSGCRLHKKVSSRAGAAHVTVIAQVTGSTNSDTADDVVHYPDSTDLTIDNSLNNYNLRLSLPSTNNWVLGVEIGYWE